MPAIARDEVLVKIMSTAVNHLDLVEASGSLKHILPSTCLGYLAMSFQGLSNRSAVTLRNGRRVMPYSVRPAEWVRTRSM